MGLLNILKFCCLVVALINIEAKIIFIGPPPCAPCTPLVPKVGGHYPPHPPVAPPMCLTVPRWYCIDIAEYTVKLLLPSVKKHIILVFAIVTKFRQFRSAAGLCIQLIKICEFWMSHTNRVTSDDLKDFRGCFSKLLETCRTNIGAACLQQIGLRKHRPCLRFWNKL